MKSTIFVLALGLGCLTASPVLASGVSFNFSGPDTTLGTSQGYTSGSATITAYGYECSAPSPSSTSTLSSCAASVLFAKDDGPNESGLGLAGEGGGENEIGWDGAHADFVVGLDVSSLFKLGVTSMTLSFGSVQPGEAYAVLGYGSDPFLGGGSIALTNTKAWVGNDGSTSAQVFSSTISLNANDEFLVMISPCGASPGKPLPCGSNVVLGSLSATTPEPGTLALFVTGLLGLGLMASRRRRAAMAKA